MAARTTQGSGMEIVKAGSTAVIGMDTLIAWTNSYRRIIGKARELQLEMAILVWNYFRRELYKLDGPQTTGPRFKTRKDAEDHYGWEHRTVSRQLKLGDRIADKAFGEAASSSPMQCELTYLMAKDIMDLLKKEAVLSLNGALMIEPADEIEQGFGMVEDTFAAVAQDRIANRKKPGRKTKALTSSNSTNQDDLIEAFEQMLRHFDTFLQSLTELWRRDVGRAKIPVHLQNEAGWQMEYLRMLQTTQFNRKNNYHTAVDYITYAELQEMMAEDRTSALRRNVLAVAAIEPAEGTED